jgi:hypothetical protein
MFGEPAGSEAISAYLSVSIVVFTFNSNLNVKRCF